MKERTYKQIETAKKRAEIAALNLMDDASRSDDFADLSVEEYAELRGITIKNPTTEERNMATSFTDQIKSLKEELREKNEELREATERVEELEAEREDVYDALGIEVVEDEDEEDDDGEEE